MSFVFKEKKRIGNGFFFNPKCLSYTVETYFIAISVSNSLLYFKSCYWWLKWWHFFSGRRFENFILFCFILYLRSYFLLYFIVYVIQSSSLFPPLPISTQSLPLSGNPHTFVCVHGSCIYVLQLIPSPSGFENFKVWGVIAKKWIQ